MDGKERVCVLICVSMCVGIYHVPVSMGPIELLSPEVCFQSSPSLRKALAYLSVYRGGGVTASNASKQC